MDREEPQLFGGAAVGMGAGFRRYLGRYLWVRVGVLE